MWEQPTTFDSTLGVDVVGGYVTAVLYGIFCLQTHIFFHRFREDKKLLKASIWVLLVLNTIHLALIVHFNYWYMVTNFANTNILSEYHPWSIPLFFLVTPSTNLLVKSWFVYRVWILSERNRLLTLTLALGVILSWAFGVAFGIELYILPTFASYENENWLFYAEFTIETFTDLGVAAALALFLLRGKSASMNRTSSVINTLLVYSVNTGFLTSLLCIASIIARAVQPNNFYFFATYMILSGLYSNALLGSLNARDWFRHEVQGVSIPLSHISSGSGGQPPHMLNATPLNHRGQANKTLSQAGIQIETEVIKAEL